MFIFISMRWAVVCIHYVYCVAVSGEVVRVITFSLWFDLVNFNYVGIIYYLALHWIAMICFYIAWRLDLFLRLNESLMLSRKSFVCIKGTYKINDKSWKCYASIRLLPQHNSPIKIKLNCKTKIDIFRAIINNDDILMTFTKWGQKKLKIRGLSYRQLAFVKRLCRFNLI